MSHHPHGPSTLPKLAKCIHFLGGKTAGEAASRGTLLHEEIADCLTTFSKPKDPSAKRGVDRAKKLIQDIRGIEEKFTLLDDCFDELTFGTIDVWGYTDGNLIVADFKSGAMIGGAESYLEQLAAYSLMVMEKEYEQECQVAIIPIDDESTEYHLAKFTLEEAKNIVLPIFERIAKGDEPPQENDGCNWCARRESCPVWVQPAEKALTLVDALPTTITREWIEESPQNAGLALAAFKKLEGIFDDLDVKGRIKTALEQGEKVPGWKIQNRKGSQSVESVEKVLIEVVKKMGTAKAASFLKVDAKALQAAWSEFTTEPLPVTLVEGAGTTSLVAERRAK